MRMRSLVVMAAIGAVVALTLGGCSDGTSESHSKILASQNALRSQLSDAREQQSVPSSFSPLNSSSNSVSAPLAQDAENRRLSLLRQKAAEGDADAQLELGVLHLLGEGVERDRDLAVDLLKRASEQGSKEASFYVASIMLSDGRREEALRLYEALGDAGHADGLRHAAMILAYQDDGVTLTENNDHLEKAKAYLAKASSLGDVLADSA